MIKGAFRYNKNLFFSLYLYIGVRIIFTTYLYSTGRNVRELIGPCVCPFRMFKIENLL